MLGRTVKEQRCDWGTELLFYYTCTTLFHYSNSNHVLFLIFVVAFYQKFPSPTQFSEKQFQLYLSRLYMYVDVYTQFFSFYVKKVFFSF